MITVDLNGNWIMKRTDDTDWIPAQVPGSVIQDLLRAGLLQDPFYRDNENLALALTAHDYEYRRSFIVDDRLLACDAVFLVCEGLDTLATIYINGDLVSATNNMHRRYEFDVKSFLRAGENDIYIVFRSALTFVQEQYDRDPLWGPDHTIAGFPHIRKAHYMFGWDWGPKIPDLGIWRKIHICGYEQARIQDVRVDQHHKDGSVDLDVHVDLDLYRSEPAVLLTVTLESPHGSVVYRTSVEGKRHNTVRISIDDPQLWWPNGYGKQPLYRLHVAITCAETPMDQRSMRIGLRTIRLSRRPDAWGESFALSVNGLEIFAKGANYIPEDSLLGRYMPQRTRRLLEDAKAAHFNLIRVWGGGIYPDDFFYDICDELGLIVWQDFMFACGVYRLTEEFADNIRQEAIDNLRRIRHHACLGLLCGNNEMELGWVDWDFPKSDDLREDYLRQFEELLPRVVSEIAPQVDYWPASPSSGGGFDSPNDENRGDVHYWDVWHGLKPFTEYRKFYFRFCSEFGFQSFPSMKTIEAFTLPEDRNVFSYVMECHQKNGMANSKIVHYMADRFRYPKDLASFVYVSQILQAEAIQYGVEHWRRHRGRCMGAVYWQLNDCWPGISWSSIDYFGRWKALHYFAKRFFAPILVSAEEHELGASLWVTNDTLQRVEGELRWFLRTTTSEILRSGVVGIRVEPLTAQLCANLDFAQVLSDAAIRRRTYLEYELQLADGVVSRGTVLFVPPKHLELQPVTVTVDVSDGKERFDLTVTTNGFAKYVALDLHSTDCVFSDNFFDVSPGQKRVIQVPKDTLSRPLTLEEFRSEIRVITLYDSYEHP